MLDQFRDKDVVIVTRLDRLARSTKDLRKTAEKLRSAACDVVWMPPFEAIYPPGTATTVEVDGPDRGFAARAFGEKDWQQTVLSSPGGLWLPLVTLFRDGVLGMSCFKPAGSLRST